MRRCIETNMDIKVAIFLELLNTNSEYFFNYYKCNLNISAKLCQNISLLLRSSTNKLVYFIIERKFSKSKHKCVLQYKTYLFINTQF